MEGSISTPTYKLKLLEQLVRIRWYGMRVTFYEAAYCAVCHTFWHGRRHSLGVVGFSHYFNCPISGGRMAAFKVNGTGFSLATFEPYDDIHGESPELRFLRLHRRTYAACRQCTGYVGLRQVMTHEPTKYPPAARRIRTYLRRFYAS